MRAAALATALLVATVAPAAEFALTPNIDSPAMRDGDPLQPATLTIRPSPGRSTDVAAGAVRLTPRPGGPAVQVPVVISPDEELSLVVPLPAVSAEQTYRAALLTDAAEAGEVMDGQDVEIAWPVDALSRDVMLDSSAYRPFADDLARWPPETRQALFAGLVLTALALTATLLIRRTGRRLAAAGGVVVLAAAGVSAAMRAAPLVEERYAEDGRTAALSSRRTVRWEGDARWRPVYYAPWQMRGDDMLIRPGAGVSLTLHPDQVRVLRRATRRE